MSGRGRTLGTVLLLLAASAASASPTIISDSSISVASRLTNDATDIVSYTPASSQLSDFAELFLNLPQVDNQATSTENNLYLPTLPPSISMVLIGFICVSMVRDRKTWMAVLTSLLWLGQAGYNALPEFSCQGRKVHNCEYIEPALAEIYSLGGDYCPDNYNEQIQYTGLLHHLEGIPRLTNAFSRIVKKDIRFSSQAPIFGQTDLNRNCDCSVSGTRRFICFTPAFIFNIIPRGPPISA